MTDEIRQATVLVFPGALNALDFTKIDSDEVEAKYIRERASSEYRNYCDNLRRLCSGFAESFPDTPLYLVGPNPIKFSSRPSAIEYFTHNYLNDLEAPDAIKIFWEMGWTCSGGWRFIGTYENPGDIKRPGKYEPFVVHNTHNFDWNNLKEQGIERVLLGGEESFDSEGRAKAVVMIAKEIIQEDLQVRGIKGCVYPPSPKPPLTNDFRREDKPIKEMLYDQAVRA